MIMMMIIISTGTGWANSDFYNSSTKGGMTAVQEWKAKERLPLLLTDSSIDWVVQYCGSREKKSYTLEARW